MGIIKEPKGVNFIIQSPPLNEAEQKEISEFITMRKAQKLAETKLSYQIKTRKSIIRSKQKS
ncbi:hypothetical protein IO90_10725 [Chryseobacterium sp. FH1]|nr:hypothetical protein IO90_10725 [Chryseobacterium sp. FH1]